jgi:hypothetical protein
MGLLDLEASEGVRTQVPSPWLLLSMKRLLNKVWAEATEAKLRAVKKYFMVDVVREHFLSGLELLLLLSLEVQEARPAQAGFGITSSSFKL